MERRKNGSLLKHIVTFDIKDILHLVLGSKKVEILCIESRDLGKIISAMKPFKDINEVALHTITHKDFANEEFSCSFEKLVKNLRVNVEPAWEVLTDKKRKHTTTIILVGRGKVVKEFTRQPGSRKNC